MGWVALGLLSGDRSMVPINFVVFLDFKDVW